MEQDVIGHERGTKRVHHIFAAQGSTIAEGPAQGELAVADEANLRSVRI